MRKHGENNEMKTQMKHHTVTKRTNSKANNNNTYFVTQALQEAWVHLT